MIRRWIARLFRIGVEHIAGEYQPVYKLPGTKHP